MIAACPKCAARYRIDRDKLGDGGARLRCSRCESVFRVRAPAERPAEAPVAAVPEVPPAEKKRAQVVVAMPDAELAKRTADALRARGLHCMVVFDGVDAMLEIQRQEPAVVLLAADLPKMFGFQVCEIVKRNASLRGIHVVLAGAVHHPERYRRSPSELYGADSFVEVPDLPEALFPLLAEAGILSKAPSPAPEPPAAPLRAEPRQPVPAQELKRSDPPSVPAAEPDPTGGLRAGLPDSAGAAFSEPAIPGPSEGSAREPETSTATIPSPVTPAPTKPVAPAASPAKPPSEELAQAERLARIIVSDIVLYNEEKFASAVQAGDVAEAMTAELAEGRGLFERRIDENVRRKTDFLLEELLRVARARGMQ